MTVVAIVGSSRLSEEERDRARVLIKRIIAPYKHHDEIITGDANGIDELVRSFASECNCMTVVKATNQQWEPNGFKKRNISIARQADRVYTIATKNIKGQKCYHCVVRDHDRTGGCWTRKYAIDELHKEGRLFVV